MTCHACGTSLSANARYCHKCGARTTTTAAAWRAGLPWGIAGLTVGALLGVMLMRARGSATGPVGDASSAGGPLPVAGSLAAPDISQMSPEERAQRLFDRVMRLAEEGKNDSMRFFLPMALGAYQQLPALSLDARFDMGLLQLAGGDAPAALAEADAITRQAPTHLFASVLRARALQAQNDTRGARQAYLQFLKNEATERARRPEYQAHSSILDTFHSEALSRTGGPPGS